MTRLRGGLLETEGETAKLPRLESEERGEGDGAVAALNE